MCEDDGVSRLNLQGAVDLSALAASPAAGASTTTSAVLDVTEATFQAEVLDRSQQLPVVIDLWATWCGPCKTLSPILERLAQEYAGRLQLVKVDVDANPRLAQAFQVQSIPTVIAVVKGQLVELFMGAQPEPQIRAVFEELLKVAAQQGLPAAPAEHTDEIAADPRFDAAVDAIEQGDWDAAEKAYRDILSTTPHDEEAKAGLAQVLLLRRTDGVDPDQALAQAASSPTNIELALKAADALVLNGRTTEAFSMLIALVASLAGSDKDTVRKHVIELFDLVGDDPAVPAARVALANALF